MVTESLPLPKFLRSHRRVRAERLGNFWLIDLQHSIRHAETPLALLQNDHMCHRPYLCVERLT